MIRDLALLFLKLGLIGFGGPAAHVALMRDEVVRRRAWLTDAEFLDLVGAVNLIPGPNSTELAILIGRRRAGWPGLIVAGVCFIAPAMLIVLALAWAYVRYGRTPEAGWLLYGVKPVIIAVVAQALWGLGRAAIKSALLAAVGTAVLGLYLAGANEIGLLAGAGLAVMLIANGQRLTTAVPALLPALLLRPDIVFRTRPPHGLAELFLTLLKIGSVLYGSGYVLFAFLEADFVDQLCCGVEQCIESLGAASLSRLGAHGADAPVIGPQDQVDVRHGTSSR